MPITADKPPYNAISKSLEYSLVNKLNTEKCIIVPNNSLKKMILCPPATSFYPTRSFS